MIYTQKGYKIDKNKILILLNLQPKDFYTQYKCNVNLRIHDTLEEQHDIQLEGCLTVHLPREIK